VTSRAAKEICNKKLEKATLSINCNVHKRLLSRKIDPISFTPKALNLQKLPPRNFYSKKLNPQLQCQLWLPLRSQLTYGTCRKSQTLQNRSATRLKAFLLSKSLLVSKYLTSTCSKSLIDSSNRIFWLLNHFKTKTCSQKNKNLISTKMILIYRKC